MPLKLTAEQVQSLRNAWSTVLKSISKVTKVLQRRKSPLNLADVRALFDQLIQNFDILAGTQIDSQHAIVAAPHLESGIVKILNGKQAQLTSAEKRDCKIFLVNQPAAGAAAGGDQELDEGGVINVDAVLRKRKADADAAVAQHQSKYFDLNCIPSGGIDVESLFSGSKYIATSHRARLLPRTLGMIVMLKHNRRYWQEQAVYEAMVAAELPGDESDEDMEDDDRDDEPDIEPEVDADVDHADAAEEDEEEA